MGSRRTRKKKEKSVHLLLDFIAGWGYNSRVTDNGLVAQLGAHHIRIVGVGSSNLLKSTIIHRNFDGITVDFFRYFLPNAYQTDIMGAEIGF